jgi:hypothetical protein
MRPFSRHKCKHARNYRQTISTVNQTGNLQKTVFALKMAVFDRKSGLRVLPQRHEIAILPPN